MTIEKQKQLPDAARPDGNRPGATRHGWRRLGGPIARRLRQTANWERGEGQRATGGADTAPAGERGRLGSLPSLSERQVGQVQEREAAQPLIVHETIRLEGEHELTRPVAALAFSGLAAGLSMGFSMVGQGLLAAYLPDTAWAHVVTSLGYSLGFVIVVLGRQQLFTENTLTAILPLLAHPDRKTWMQVGRLWSIVLLTNLLGAFVFATFVAHTALFPPAILQTFMRLGEESLRGTFGTVVVRGIFAGWLVALMVWLLPEARATRLHIIVILTYFVSLGNFAHIVAGATDALLLVSQGLITWETFFVGFLVPTLLGNILGGCSLVAGLNFAQVATEAGRGRGE